MPIHSEILRRTILNADAARRIEARQREQEEGNDLPIMTQPPTREEQEADLTTARPCSLQYGANPPRATLILLFLAFS